MRMERDMQQHWQRVPHGRSKNSETVRTIANCLVAEQPDHHKQLSEGNNDQGFQQLADT